MRNDEYWRLRDALDRRNEDELLHRLAQLLEESYYDTEREIYAFYGEFSTDNSLSYEEAIRLLTPIELKECSNRIKRLKAIADNLGNTPFELARKEQIKREIRILQGRGRITRLQALSDSINEKWIETTLEIDKELGELLSETFTREYRESLLEAGVRKTLIPIKQVEAAILIPTFGRHFSDNVWRNKDNIVAFINSEVRKGLVTGQDVRETAKILQLQEAVAYHQAERLVRTENCVARTQGTLNGYKNSGTVNAVEILVANDERMCSDCGSRAGTVIQLDKAVMGNNIPPFHCNCRCCILPVID